MASPADSAPIDRQTLTAPVRTALGRDTATILDWQRDTLAGAGAHTGGVYRLAGRADNLGETLAWSLVLKVLHPAGGDTDPAGPNFWKREVLAYESGLLSALPKGVTAPRCFGVTAYGDERVWLWLEEVTDTGGPRWPLSCYGTAAYRLGQFNGSAWGEPALLAAPWLSHGGRWLAQFPRDLAASFLRVLEHPLVRQVCPDGRADRLLQLLADQAMFLAALDHLPRCFCHHDAWRRNLVLRPDPPGLEQAVLLDWDDAGSGAIGQELAAFVAAPVAFGDLDVAALPDLEDLAWSRYLDGLRDVGWRDDPTTVRLGYTAAVALRSVAIAWLCATYLADERAHRRLEAYFGHSLEEIVTILARLLPFLLNRADEARGLLRAL